MQNTDENKPVVNENNTVELENQLQEIELTTNEENTETFPSEEELSGWNKTQLAEKLEDLLSQDDIVANTNNIKLLKDVYDKQVAEEYQRKLKIFTQDGDKEEDFEPAVDPLDNKVETLIKNFNKRKTDLRKQKEKSLQENLATKLMVVEELRELLKTEENFSKAYNKFQALQTKWRTTGNVPKNDMHTLWENYNFLSGKFYEFIKINNELRELDRKKNLEIKHELCDKAEKLVGEPSLKKALAELTLLQEQWRESNNLNRELSDPLWQRFKISVDKIFERRKEHAAKVKIQLESNLAAKTALCERIEALTETDLSSHKLCRDAAEKVEAIWAEWQKIGYVPKSDNGNCWNRFKKLRSNFQRKVDAYYALQRGLFSQNLQQKVDLCVNAESLQESPDFEATAEILKKLQVEWKTIGPVAVKDSQPIWNRFRKACDHFFERKNKQVEEKENALKANVQIREAIILKLDQLQPLEDITQSIEALKQVQDEWTATGEVPYREKDRLNNSFGKSAENFLEKLKGSTPAEHKMFYRLKYEQLLKYPEGQERIKKERYALQDKIKKLEAEANQLDNNLGFFGKSKKANPLLEGYLKQLEEVKQELSKLREQLKMIPSIN